jgi:hypothetical protein
MSVRILCVLIACAVSLVNAGEKKSPPPDVTAAVRAELAAGAEELGKVIAQLKTELKDKPALLDLLPDVQIFYNAVHYAAKYNEFFNGEKDVPSAKALLKQGHARAKMLKDGNPDWPKATGLVVRGYVSKIDGSVQPYGLVVPPSFAENPNTPRRLDFWLHGRDEKLSELNFLQQRQKSAGEFTPKDAFVLHLYGRYCNANKFAGEVDCFEALEHASRHYKIDENRLCMRGFSMGGAACWHFAAHHSDRWAAAAPGAGFAETPVYSRALQDPNNKPPEYEQTLWHLYDCTDYAVNLFNCPTVAYSGEIDKQKQAADIMAKAMKEEGLELKHVIGPQTEHKYHKDSKIEIDAFLDPILEKGRNPVPPRVRFTTWTLRYNKMFWVTLNGLDKHWTRARVDAEIAGNDSIKATTQNVTALSLNFPAKGNPFGAGVKPKVTLDGQTLEGPAVAGAWTAHFVKNGKTWSLSETPLPAGLSKRHGLQGPIDDAFMDSFIMVTPTGKAMNDKVGAWASKEQARGIEQWRKQFRGDARVVSDEALTEEQIASSNLVLWGDPSSNKVLAKIAAKLPIKWNEKGVQMGGQNFAADQHVPVMIYPNPLNPDRYIVINSVFTFREWPVSNAKQVPMLPDYAIVDISAPPVPRYPGKIVSAGFFNEKWELAP